MLPKNLQAQAGSPPLLSFGASAGTGFFVGSGTILTAGHVVRGCQMVTVSGDGFAAGRAELLAVDNVDDLALLKVAVSAPAALNIAAGGWGRSAETVVRSLTRQDFGAGTTMGYLGTSASVRSQTVTLPRSVLSSDHKTFYRVANGLFEQGESGSPIIYQSGDVAGVLLQTGSSGPPRKASDGYLEAKIGLFVAGPVARDFVLRNGARLINNKTAEPEEAIVHVFCFTGLPNW